MNIGVHVSFQISALIFLDIYSGVELLNRVVVLFLVFFSLRNLYIVFHNRCTNFHSSSSPTFVICRLFDDTHSDRCENNNNLIVIFICIVIFISFAFL